MLINCPSCGAEISGKAFDCPKCGHPVRKPKRGFFGRVFKGLFVLFNILMVVWLFSYFGEIGGMSDELTSDAERAGAAIGGTIGTGLILGVWVMGDIILGLLTLLTRTKK